MDKKIILKETARDECRNSYEVTWNSAKSNGVLKDFLSDLEEYIAEHNDDQGSIQIREVGTKNKRPRAVATLTYKNGGSINDLDTLPENIKNCGIVEVRSLGYWNEMDYYITVKSV